MPYERFDVATPWQAGFMTGVEGALGKAAGGLVMPAVTRGWRRLRPDTSWKSRVQYADDLAAAVRRRETDLLDQLRGGPDKVMDLEFQAQPRVRSATADIGTLKDVGPYFRQIASPQRLIVLGEAGAGKTVLAIRLLLDQLQDRAKLPDTVRADTPVPVRVNASGWDGSESFTEWLAYRLSVDHGLHGRVARALVDGGHVLPLIDGLDEMDPPEAEPERACAALARLNEPPWGNRSVVLMCRTTVFTRIRQRRGDAGLHGATDLTLQPFSATDIRTYLQRFQDHLGIADDQWAPVTDQLAQTPDGPLATGLRTPWLLGLATTALHRDHRTTAELAACRTATEIRDLLFASMIPAAVAGTQRTGNARSYTVQNVQMWMQALARHLEHQRNKSRGGVEIALDQIWEFAGSRRCRILHALALGTALGLVGGLAGGRLVGLVGGLLGGLVGGLLGGLVGGAPSMSAAERIAWRVPGRSRWRKALVGGLLVGLAGGLAGGLAFGLAGGLVLGLAVGLAFGLVFGFDTNSEDRLSLGQDERRIIRNDVVAALVFALVFALVSGLVLGLVIGLVGGLVSGLGAGLVLGLMWGVAAERYAIASLLLRITRTFPSPPAPFLGWARNTGILRVTGVSYQFRHDTYQQWLAQAALNETPSTAPPITANEN